MPINKPLKVKTNREINLSVRDIGLIDQLIDSAWMENGQTRQYLSCLIKLI